MEDEHGPAGFSIDLVNSHVIAKCLQEFREIQLIVGTSCYQGGVGDRVVAFSEVDLSEVVAWDVCVLVEDFIGQGEVLGGGDGWLSFKLEDNFLFSQGELPGKKL